MINPKVLLIDDEPEIRDVLRRFFEKRGCEVFHANDGIEGLEKLNEHAPHVIVTDLRMPRMCGVTFLDTLMNSEDKSALPVTVVFSGAFTPEVYTYVRGRADLLLEKGFIEAGAFVETALALAATRYPSVAFSAAEKIRH